MKTIALALAVACQLCAAADFNPANADGGIEVGRRPFGSGTPQLGASAGAERADYIAGGLYHVPNYLPGFPTAATLWPREVTVECAPDPATGRPSCGGYSVRPALGRGEYIFIRPVMKPAPVPAVIVVPERSCRCAALRRKPLPKARKKPLG